MPRATIFRRIILPQAMRVIVPPIGNEMVSMLKTTSLSSATLHAGADVHRAPARPGDAWARRP